MTRQRSWNSKDEAPHCNVPLWGAALLSLCVLVWQYYTLSGYSAGWPSSLWTGLTSTPLNSSCEDLFWVMHWCAFLTTMILPLEVFILLTDLVPNRSQICLPCLILSAPLACVLVMVRIVLAFWGFWTVFFATLDEAAQCPELYFCAWWSYQGLLVLLLLLGCCCCCCTVLRNPDMLRVSDDADDADVDAVVKETTPLRGSARV